MPFVVAIAAGLVLLRLFGTHTGQQPLPSNPVLGQKFAYKGPNGETVTAMWNGSSWVVVG